MLMIARCGLIVISGLLHMAAAFGEPGNPMTVCQVLSDLGHYRGKFISIRGIYEWGTHGWILSDNADWQPCPTVEIQGHTWPPAIYLRVAQKDRKRIDAILSRSKQIVHENNEKMNADIFSVIATFTGKLDYEDDVEIRRNEDGWYHGTGYGQEGMYRASLIIENVQKVSIVKKETK